MTRMTSALVLLLDLLAIIIGLALMISNRGVVVSAAGYTLFVVAISGGSLIYRARAASAPGVSDQFLRLGVYTLSALLVAIAGFGVYQSPGARGYAVAAGFVLVALANSLAVRTLNRTASGSQS